MSNIVQFRPVQKKKEPQRNRVEALMKGQVRTFNCDSCGGEFEVLYNNFPDKCPHCGLEFDWGNSTYDRTR